MKLRQKILSFALSLILIFSNIINLSSNVAYAKDNLGGNSDIKMSVDAFDNGKINNKKTEYYSGEPMTVINDIQVSGTDIDLKNPYMLVKVPKSKYLVRPEFVESNEAISSEINLEDDKFWYAKYTYSRIQGGFKAAYKALFNFKNEITPPGTPVKIDFEFRSSDDKIIKSASKTFTAKATDNFAPYISVTYSKGRTTDEFRVGVPDPSITTIPKKAQKPTYYVGSRLITEDPIIKEKNGAWGVYKPKTFTYKVKFDDNPLYGEFVTGHIHALNSQRNIKSDEWDADTNTLIVKCEKFSNNDSAFHFNIDYAGEPTETWFNNHVELVLDEGLPTEKTTTPIENEDKTKVKYKLFKQAPGESGVYKYHKSDQYKRTYKYWDYISEYLFDNNELYNVNEELKQVGYDDKDQVEMLWKLGISNWHRDYNNDVLKVYEIKDKLDKKVGSEFPYTKVSNYNYSIGDSTALYYENFVIPRDRIFKYTKNTIIETAGNYGEQSDVTFKQEYIDNVAKYLTDTGYKLIGVKQDGSEEVIKEKVVLDEKVRIHDTSRKYKHLIARFDENNPLILENVSIQALVGTNLVDSEKEKWQKSTENLKIEYYNYVDFSVKRVNDKEKVTLSRKDYITVIKGEEWAYNASGWRDGTQDGMPLTDPILKSYKKDPKKRYMSLYPSTHFKRSTSLPEGQKLKNLRDVVLLPVGVEYVKTEYTKKEGVRLDEPLEPTIIKNYKNTGKTALIYNYGDLDKDSIGNRFKNYSKVIVDPTVYTKDGLNHIEFYSVWDNPKVIVDNPYDYKDALDLDSDGNTEEILSKRVMDFTFILPLEVITTKNISLDKKNWMLESPRTDIGDDLYYKLKINNQYARAITDIQGLDTLPYKGDHTMCADENGNYLLRGEVKGLAGSDYTTPLVEAIENIPENEKFLKKFDVFYSTTPAGADIASVSGINDWKTKDQITDFTKVKNIYFVLKKGQEIPSGAFEEVITHNRMEDRTSITLDDKAINSFATNEDHSRYNEANEVISRPIKYSVEGAVFRDVPKDGKFTNTKNKISNYKVQLVYAEDFTDKKGEAHKAGEVVVDHGKKLETLTDKNGHYFINVYKRGKYQIKFINQDNKQVFTDVNKDRDKDFSNINKVVGKDGSIKNGYSDIFTLDPYNINYKEDGSIDTTKPSLHRIRNAGIIENKLDVKLNKIGIEEGQDFDTGKALEGIKFSLTKIGGDKFGQTLTTDKAGNIEFKNVPFGSYELKEEATVDGYKKLGSIKVVISETKGIEISKFNSDTTIDNARLKDTVIQIKNEPIYGVIKVIKKDGTNKALLENVKFNLYRKNGDKFEIVNDVVGANKGNAKIAVTNDKGEAVFSKIKLGTYIVKELQDTLPEGYVLTEQSKEFKLTGTAVAKMEENKAVIEYINNRIMGSVEVAKLDKEDKKVIPNTIFTLTPNKNVTQGTPAQKQDGVDVFEVTTNNKGIALFENVPLGEYTLSEKTPATGYNNADISKELAKVVIDKDKQIIKKEVFNTKIKGSLKITKVDAEDENLKLQGVKFGLYKKVNGNISDKLEAEATTDANGVAEFTNVIYGNYVIKELQTLENYELDNKTITPIKIIKNGEVIEKTLNNKKIKGSVIFTKVDAEDENKKLSGVTFELQQNGKTKYTATSSKDGKVKFDNVLYGVYDLVEVKTLENYNSLETQKAAVNIDIQGKEVNLGNVTNQIKKGSVSLVKVDAEDESKKLSGVKFGLFQDDKKVYEAVTDAEGKALFTGVVYGKYDLREISTLKNYNLSNELKIINIDEDKKHVEVGNINNKIIKGDLKVVKKDADTKELLKGVEFSLYQGDKKLDTKVTDENGEILFENLVYGQYQLKETSTLKEYVLNNNIVDVEIYEEGKTVEKEVFNTKKKSNVLLTKVDKDNKKELLSGVKFGLFQNDKKVYEAVTNAEGKALFTGVIYGEYKLKEIETLANYNLSTEEKDVNIDADGKVVELGNITNQIKKGSVIFTKVDKEDENKKLSGVTFELQQNGKTKYTATSSKDGKVKFENVIYGIYDLVETKSLDNYNKLDKQERVVNIDAEGKIVDLGNITNQIKKGSVSLVKVDAEDESKKLSGVKFGLFKDGKKIYEAVTDADGKALFTGIVYGEYKLKEIETLANYNLSTEEKDVKVDAEGKIVELGNITNQIKKGSVSLVKVDAEDESKKLSGVKFGLFKDGKKIYEAVTDKEGKALFTGVIYGEYKLKEIETIKGYKLSKQEILVKVIKDGEKIDLGKFKNEKEKVEKPKHMPSTGDSSNNILQYGFMVILMGLMMLVSGKKRV